jgi:hypothetical protein
MSAYATIVTKTGPKSLPKELDPKNHYGGVYGNSITECWDQLTPFAIQLGVSPLTAFTSRQWSDPAPALAAVSALIQLLRQTDVARLRGRLNDRVLDHGNLEWVIFDLTAYEAILKKAVADKDTFRFDVG